MTTIKKGYVLVEGHGELEAVGNLLARLSQDAALTFPWSRPLRWNKLHQEQELSRGAEYIRKKPDVAALLILRDEDDGCPRETGPQIAA